MTTYFNRTGSYTVSSYNELIDMVDYFVGLGKWTYVSSAASAYALFSINDSFAASMPFYVKVATGGSDNTIIITFGSTLSGDNTNITNKGVGVTPYTITLTDTATGGTSVIASEHVVNGYDSGLSILQAKIKMMDSSSRYYGATNMLNIERAYSLDGTKTSDIIAIGYTCTMTGTSGAAGIVFMTTTHADATALSASSNIFNIISTPTTKTSHEFSRPAYFVYDEAAPTNATKGWLPQNPMFNQETLTMLMCGPFPYSATKKLYNNPYLITCSNGYTGVRATTFSADNNYPYLLTKNVNVDLYVNGTSRSFYVPQLCIGRPNATDEVSQYGHYYLFATE
jgi:hypothetical protein